MPPLGFHLPQRNASFKGLTETLNHETSKLGILFMGPEPSARNSRHLQQDTRRL